MALFEFSPLDVILASCGLPLFLFDIVLDIWAAVEFYKEEKYWCLAVLLLLLIGSSVLAQLFSWLWYSYDNFNLNTTVEKGVEPCLGVLHYVQLGIYVRCVSSSSMSLICSFSRTLVSVSEGGTCLSRLLFLQRFWFTGSSS